MLKLGVFIQSSGEVFEYTVQQGSVEGKLNSSSYKGIHKVMICTKSPMALFTSYSTDKEITYCTSDHLTECLLHTVHSLF